jgi:hypothetical protein
MISTSAIGYTPIEKRNTKPAALNAAEPGAAYAAR